MYNSILQHLVLYFTRCTSLSPFLALLPVRLEMRRPPTPHLDTPMRMIDEILHHTPWLPLPEVNPGWLIPCHLAHGTPRPRQSHLRRHARAAPPGEDTQLASRPAQPSLITMMMMADD